MYLDSYFHLVLPSQFGRSDLLTFMKKYWVSQGSKDTSFWAHECKFKSIQPLGTRSDFPCSFQAWHMLFYLWHQVLFALHGTRRCCQLFRYCNQGLSQGNEIHTSILAHNWQLLQYPTYQWLADANITPSNSTTYTLSAIQGALKQASGATPYLGCQGGALSEVWYFNHVAGAVQDLQFTPVDSTTATTCPSSGIHYYQRANGSEQ